MPRQGLQPGLCEGGRLAPGVSLFTRAVYLGVGAQLHAALLQSPADGFSVDAEAGGDRRPSAQLTVGAACPRPRRSTS
jgi:hypothetical protein